MTATLLLLPWAWGDYYRTHGELAAFMTTKFVGHAAAAGLLLWAGRGTGGPVAVAQPGPGRLRGRRHRRGDLVGDGPLSLAGLPGDRPDQPVGRDRLRQGRLDVDAGRGTHERAVDGHGGGDLHVELGGADTGVLGRAALGGQSATGGTSCIGLFRNT